jgi:hypothetical protein
MEASKTVPIISEAVKPKNPLPPFDCRDILFEVLEHVMLTDEERF